MSNFDYLFGYPAMSKKQYIIVLVKHWLLKMIKLGILIFLAYLFYRIFIYNPIPNFKARNSESIEIISLEQNNSLPKTKLQEKIIDKVPEEASYIQEISNIPKEKALILSVQDTPTINVDNLPKEKENTTKSLAKPLVNDTESKLAGIDIENGMLNEKADLQSKQQISKIIKQIALDKENKVSLSLLKGTKELSIKNNKTKEAAKTQILYNHESLEKKAEQSTSDKDDTPQALAHIQKRYEQDLIKLTNEVELENLLKDNFSSYLDN